MAITQNIGDMGELETLEDLFQTKNHESANMSILVSRNGDLSLEQLKGIAKAQGELPESIKAQWAELYQVDTHSGFSYFNASLIGNGKLSLSDMQLIRKPGKFVIPQIDPYSITHTSLSMADFAMYIDDKSKTFFENRIEVPNTSYEIQLMYNFIPREDSSLLPKEIVLGFNTFYDGAINQNVVVELKSDMGYYFDEKNFHISSHCTDNEYHFAFNSEGELIKGATKFEDALLVGIDYHFPRERIMQLARSADKEKGATLHQLALAQVLGLKTLKNDTLDYFSTLKNLVHQFQNPDLKSLENYAFMAFTNGQS